MSFGVSKQNSNQQATSNQVGGGEQISQSFGQQGAQSTSLSQGGSQSSSQQTVAFEDLFKSLYGGASAAAAGADTGAISTQAKQLFTSGTGFLDSLSSVGSDAGTSAQLDVLKSQLGDFFNEQVLPGITREGVSTGTFGGSRDAIAKELAAKSVAGQFSTGAAQILGQQNQEKIGAAGTGLSALQSLLNIGSSEQFAGLQPYQILAQIMGGPTVLGSSVASSEELASQLSNSFGTQGSQSYGYDFNRGSSQSTGNSSGFSIGGGVGGGAPKG